MGLFKLLTFPITGPISGTRWVAEVVLEQAERELYDEDVIRQKIEALQTRRELGKIDQQQFEEQEEALWERLLEARAYHRRRIAGGDR